MLLRSIERIGNLQVDRGFNISHRSTRAECSSRQRKVHQIRIERFTQKSIAAILFVVVTQRNSLADGFFGRARPPVEQLQTPCEHMVVQCLLDARVPKDSDVVMIYRMLENLSKGKTSRHPLAYSM